MAICGLNLNISSIQGELTSQVSGFLNLETGFTTPSSITAYLSTFESGIDAIKAKVDLAIPDIPTSISGFTSLRDQLSAYVSVPSIGGLASLTSQFGGLTSLTGMANINLADMAKSAFSLGASFDPCSLAGDLKIPNIVANAAGELEALADQAPDFGGTIMALKRQIPDSKVFDSLALAAKDNVHVLTSTSIADAKQLFGGMQPMLSSLKSTAATMATALPSPAEVQSVVQNIKPFVDEAIQKLPNGEEVIRTLDRKVEQGQAIRTQLEDEDSPRSAIHKLLRAKADRANLKILKHRLTTEGLDFLDTKMYKDVKVKQVMVGDYGHQFPMWVNDETHESNSWRPEYTGPK